jgi:hypothetical protein
VTRRAPVFQLALEAALVLPVAVARRVRQRSPQAKQTAQVVGLVARQKLKAKTKDLNPSVVLEAVSTEIKKIVVPKPTVISPIADYAEMSASQIVPLLSGLTTDDLLAIEQIETAGRNRRTILAAIVHVRV